MLIAYTEMETKIDDRFRVIEYESRAVSYFLTPYEFGNLNGINVCGTKKWAMK